MSKDKANFADQLGAQEAVIVPPGNSPPAPKHKLDIIISTIPYALDVVAYLNHLAPDGTLVFVGVPPEKVSLPIGELLKGRCRMMGSGIGSRPLIAEMLSIAEHILLKDGAKIGTSEIIENGLCTPIFLFPG